MKGEIKMATYLMFGKYSADSIKGISAERTGKANAVLQKYGGEMKAGYALLGEHDLVLIVDLPDTEQAVKASVALSKLTGIGFSTSPAVSVADFDKLMEAG
jgi:uncharacterized protein with GYD domain